MGSSSSGFFRRPRLMNLASSAGVMPLWGMLFCGALPPAMRREQPNNASTKGCPVNQGTPMMFVGFRCGVLLAQTLSQTRAL